MAYSRYDHIVASDGKLADTAKKLSSGQTKVAIGGHMSEQTHPISLLLSRVANNGPRQALGKGPWKTLEDIASRREAELLRIPGISNITVGTIKMVLAEHGLSLAG